MLTMHGPQYINENISCNVSSFFFQQLSKCCYVESMHKRDSEPMYQLLGSILTQTYTHEVSLVFVNPVYPHDVPARQHC